MLKHSGNCGLIALKQAVVSLLRYIVVKQTGLQLYLPVCQQPVPLLSPAAAPSRNLDVSYKVLSCSSICLVSCASLICTDEPRSLSRALLGL